MLEGGITEAIPEITEALVRRATRGRPDAIKLALEIAGIHNPRVSHEHSGDITVTLASVPRPEPVVNPNAQLEEPVVDAEVVEE